MTAAIFITAAVLAFVCWAIFRVGTAKTTEEQAAEDDAQMADIDRIERRHAATVRRYLAVTDEPLTVIERQYLSSTLF